MPHEHLLSTLKNIGQLAGMLQAAPAPGKAKVAANALPVALEGYLGTPVYALRPRMRFERVSLAWCRLRRMLRNSSARWLSGREASVTAQPV